MKASAVTAKAKEWRTPAAMLPNNGMHPTANSVAFIRETCVVDTPCARRVMPGVRAA